MNKYEVTNQKICQCSTIRSEARRHSIKSMKKLSLCGQFASHSFCMGDNMFTQYKQCMEHQYGMTCEGTYHRVWIEHRLDELHTLSCKIQRPTNTYDLFLPNNRVPLQPTCELEVPVFTHGLVPANLGQHGGCPYKEDRGIVYWCIVHVYDLVLSYIGFNNSI